MNKLVTNKTKVQKVKDLYVVDQADQATLYASIVAGTTVLPDNSYVKLIDNSNAELLRLTGVKSTWATSFPVGGAPSTAQVSAALAAKTQIAALTANATADGSDAATTQALANSLKTSVNAIIAALKA